MAKKSKERLGRKKRKVNPDWYYPIGLFWIVCLLIIDVLEVGGQQPYNEAYWFAMIMAFIIFDMTIGFEVGFHSKTMHFPTWTKIFIAMCMPQLMMALLLKGIIGLTVPASILSSLIPMSVFVISVGMGATIRSSIKKS